MRKFLFYTLNIIWGFPTAIIGCIISLALLITGHKPKRHCGCWYFEVGEGWGGMEMGLMFLCSKDASTHIKNHEFGHGIQTCVFGPLMLLIVSAPSCARYWLREMQGQQKKKTFSLLLYIAIILIGILSAIPIILTGILPLLLIPAFIITYGTIIYLWLIKKEIPKYENNTYVPYDEIWFEGSATKLGTDWSTKWNK